MTTEQGKISMRLFKKEKIKSTSEDVIVLSENKKRQGTLVNQLEIIFEPVFLNRFNHSIESFIEQWRMEFPNYKLKKVFYRINEEEDTELYISFITRRLLDSNELEIFFKAIERFYKKILQEQNQIHKKNTLNRETHGEPVQPVQPVQSVQSVQPVPSISEMIESVDDITLPVPPVVPKEEDDLLKKVMDAHYLENAKLFDKVTHLEEQNQQLRLEIERLQNQEIENAQFKSRFLAEEDAHQRTKSLLEVEKQTNKVSMNQYENQISTFKMTIEQLEKQIQTYDHKIKLMEAELIPAHEVESLRSKLEASELNNQSIVKQLIEAQKEAQESSFEGAKLISRVSTLESELSSIHNLYREEKENIESSLKEEMTKLEIELSHQKQQYQLAYSKLNTLENLSSKLEKENKELDIEIEKLKHNRDILSSSLDKEVENNQQLTEKLKEQAAEYWKQDKQLKKWIEQAQSLENSLELERGKVLELEQNPHADIFDDLQKQLNEIEAENRMYQNKFAELRSKNEKLEESVLRLQDTMTIPVIKTDTDKLIQEYSYQEYYEEESYEEESNTSKENEVESSKSTITHQEREIINRFKEADNADLFDIKLPVDEYKRQKLIVKFIEYRFNQAKLIQKKSDNKVDLSWSEPFIKSAMEFFEDLKEEVKYPIFSKKQVIIPHDMKVRLDAYEMLSEYIESTFS